MAWDWAKGHFTNFSIVFFVRLKLVKPGHTVEDVLIQQCPSLRQQGVRPHDVRQILDKFGEKCLIILDRFDQFDSKEDKGVMRIIKREMFIHCHVLLTSRPDSTVDVAKYFGNEFEIKGFTKERAWQYCSKSVEEDQRKAIMSFYDNNFVQGSTVFTSPMLLQLLCLLVRSDSDLFMSRKNVVRGEIYWRLMRWIYRKYCEVQKKEFQQEEFKDVLTKIGKFAFKTFRKKKSLFKREEVIRELGENVFELGFLVEHKDFRLAAETADIVVTFLHETMRTFLAFFYLHQRECSGEIDSRQCFLSSTDEGFLLGNCATDIHSLHFYLWFKSSNKTDTMFGFDLLNEWMDEVLNVRTLDWVELQKLYSAINIRLAVEQQDNLVLSFIQAALSRCDAIRYLFLDVDDPVDWIMKSLHHLRDKIKLIRVMNPIQAIDTNCIAKVRSLGKRKVLIEAVVCSKVEHFLKFFPEPFDLVVFGITYQGKKPINLSALMTPGVRQLHFVDHHRDGLLRTICDITENVQCSYNLTHLVLNYVRITRSIILALSQMMQIGNLPMLEQIDLEGCSFARDANFVSLFESASPRLTHLNVNCKLKQEQLETFLLRCFRNTEKLPRLKNLILSYESLEASSRDFA